MRCLTGYPPARRGTSSRDALRLLYGNPAPTTTRRDFNTVGAAAAGRWSEILRHLAPGLTDALDRPGRHVPCPVHGGRDGFRVFRDVERLGGGICNTCGAFHDGFALLEWANGWRPAEALREVAAYLGLADQRVTETTTRPRPVPATRPSTQEPDIERTRARLRTLWNAALPLDHQQAEAGRTYLTARGLGKVLQDLPHGLRLHPALDYWHPGPARKPVKLGTFPALIAVVTTPNGEGCGLLRTYLAVDGRGKASIPDPDNPNEHLPAKKLLSLHPGATKGGAIRLYPAGPRLAVAEGLETALAVRIATGLPVWATVSAIGMAALVIPESVRELVICADHDASGTGERAARALARRAVAAGILTRTSLPEQAGADWADVLKGVRHG